MAYEDDELFEDEFDFVDDDDSQVDAEQSTSEADEESEGRRPSRTSPQNKRSGPADKKKSKSTNRRTKKDDRQETTESGEPDEQAAAAADAEKGPSEPEGPPADHVIHIYEYGQFKRTITRQFTDVEAVSFAEEYSRTGKPYGRLAIPAHQDDPPAESFADAAKM